MTHPGPDNGRRVAGPSGGPSSRWRFDPRDSRTRSFDFRSSSKHVIADLSTPDLSRARLARIRAWHRISRALHPPRAAPPCSRVRVRLAGARERTRRSSTLNWELPRPRRAFVCGTANASQTTPVPESPAALGEEFRTASPILPYKHPNHRVHRELWPFRPISTAPLTSQHRHRTGRGVESASPPASPGVCRRRKGDRPCAPESRCADKPFPPRTHARERGSVIQAGPCPRPGRAIAALPP